MHYDLRLRISSPRAPFALDLVQVLGSLSRTTKLAQPFDMLRVVSRAEPRASSKLLIRL